MKNNNNYYDYVNYTKKEKNKRIITVLLTILIILFMIFTILISVGMWKLYNRDNATDENNEQYSDSSDDEDVVSENDDNVVVSDVDETVVEDEAYETSTLSPTPYKAKSKYSDVSYTEYKNGRYGFSVSVPDFMISNPPPENGDGRSYHSEDNSIEMLVYASHIIPDESGDLFESAYNDAYDSLDYEPVYESKGENSFVISGYKNGDIVYEKHVVTDVESVLVLSYPKSEKKDLDEVVNHVAKSLKGGSSD